MSPSAYAERFVEQPGEPQSGGYDLLSHGRDQRLHLHLAAHLRMAPSASAAFLLVYPPIANLRVARRSVGANEIHLVGYRARFAVCIVHGQRIPIAADAVDLVGTVVTPLGRTGSPLLHPDRITGVEFHVYALRRDQMNDDVARR